MARLDNQMLLIRADASAVIGTGHVMRCVALAQAWQDAGGTARFITAEMPQALKSRVVTEGFSLVSLEAIPGSEEDARASVAEARQANAGWIVVDGDRFSSDFLAHLDGTGFHVLLIDDFAARKPLPVDLVVNPNLGADPASYRACGFQGVVLAGTSYALLRREFRTFPERRSRTKGNRILITLGGSDPENLAPRITFALANCAELELTIVAGAGYSDVGELKKIGHRNLRVIVDPPNMAELMIDADLAVIAAGGTLWELLAGGCPVLSYSRNSVQARVVQTLSEEGAVVDMGDTSRFEPTRLLFEVKRLADSHSARAQMVSLSRPFIDGLGAARIVEAICQFGDRRWSA